MGKKHKEHKKHVRNDDIPAETPTPRPTYTSGGSAMRGGDFDPRIKTFMKFALWGVIGYLALQYATGGKLPGKYAGLNNTPLNLGQNRGEGDYAERWQPYGSPRPAQRSAESSPGPWRDPQGNPYRRWRDCYSPNNCGDWHYGRAPND